MLQSIVRHQRVLLAIGLFLYCATRLFHLESALPLFVDEARQMRWAAVGRVERPMESGKALQVWAIAPFMQADATRGVWAARAVSVAAGVLALSAAYLLGSTLGTTLTGFIAGSLYLLCPFALFYDRMALGDAFLSGFAALSAVASIQLTRGHGRGVWLGCFMAAAIVAKATGMVVLATPVLAAVLLGAHWNRNFVRRMAGAYGVCIALAGFPTWSFLRAGGEVEQKAMLAGAGAFRDNAVAMVAALAQWWTTPLAVAVAAASLAALFSRRREWLLLLSLVLGPALLLAFGARVWYPRYLLFVTIPALVLVADWLRVMLERVSSRGVLVSSAVIGVSAIFLTPAIRFDAALLQDPALAPLPPVERFQYVDGWPSGYGTVAALRHVQAQLGPGEEAVVTFHRWADQSSFYVFAAAAFSDRRIHVREQNLAECSALRAAFESPSSRHFVALATPERGQPYPSPQCLAELFRSQPVRFTKPNGMPALNLYAPPLT